MASTAPEEEQRRRDYFADLQEAGALEAEPECRAYDHETGLRFVSVTTAEGKRTLKSWRKPKH